MELQGIVSKRRDRPYRSGRCRHWLKIKNGSPRPHVEGKILSLFEPSTEIIRKGKAGKPNEFGKIAKLQEAENQIIVDYEVYARRPNDFGEYDGMVIVEVLMKPPSRRLCWRRCRRATSGRARPPF
jgi:hypothetical protein